MGDRKQPAPVPAGAVKPTPPPVPPAKRLDNASADSEVRSVAALVVARILEVYRPEYIARCVATEPNSLLALTKRLESALLRAME